MSDDNPHAEYPDPGPRCLHCGHYESPHVTRLGICVYGLAIDPCGCREFLPAAPDHTRPAQE
ncbi:hypothetical protein [Streptomyces mexicanus]|uniref:hypothetical protein n=1 Tax=Streptomyces mexicanus TaxID=178566 RepID=UPI00366A0B23